MRAGMRAGAATLAMITSACAIEPSAFSPGCMVGVVASPAGFEAHGALEFLGGVELRGDERFGGISGLTVASAGGGPETVVLSAVTDRGDFLTLQAWPPPPDGTVRARCSRLTPLEGAPTKAGKPSADAEGLALLPSDPSLRIVSFEQLHRLEIFDPVAGGAPLGAGPALGDISALGDNLGLEALTALPSGALLAGAESPDRPAGDHPVWRIAPTDEPGGRAFADAEGPAFSLATAGPGFGLVGFDVTPAGNLLVMERSYAPEVGNAIAISWLPGPAAETATGRVEPAALARLDGGARFPIDNFEGIASSRARDGRTLVWIVSDDNFSDSQKTLLYLFLFDEAALLADAEG